jgi:hypothetical protein
MDDMGIHTKREANESEEQHVERHRQYVWKVLNQLVEHNLYLEPTKCTFKQTSMDYLGIIIKPGEIHTEEAKSLFRRDIALVSCGTLPLSEGGRQRQHHTTFWVISASEHT